DAQRLLKEVPSRGRQARTDGRGQIAADVNRLKRRLASLVAIDFFGAPRRRAAQEEVARLEARLRPRETQVPPPAHPAQAPRGLGDRPTVRRQRAAARGGHRAACARHGALRRAVRGAGGHHGRDRRGPQDEEVVATVSLRAFLLYFLRLGTLGFGGPIALAG